MGRPLPPQCRAPRERQAAPAAGGPLRVAAQAAAAPLLRALASRWALQTLPPRCKAQPRPRAQQLQEWGRQLCCAPAPQQWLPPAVACCARIVEQTAAPLLLLLAPGQSPLLLLFRAAHPPLGC